MVIYRRRATGVAFLRPPPGGSNAYKADTRKPKGLIRLIRSYSLVLFGLTRLLGCRKRVAAFRRVIVVTFADRRYKVENKLLVLESAQNRVGRSEFESSR